MKMKRMALMCATFIVAASAVLAGEKFDLKSITRGEFAGESLSRVSPLADGDTYAQISPDGKQILTYSFKTGKRAAVLFDANTVRGAKINRSVRVVRFTATVRICGKKSKR